jgi:hypothetical protein
MRQAGRSLKRTGRPNLCVKKRRYSNLFKSDFGAFPVEFCHDLSPLAAFWAVHIAHFPHGNG